MIFNAQGICAVHKGSKRLQISEQENKLCSFYEITPEEQQALPVSHHILLVDVSGSMYEEIPELKVKVKQTLDALKVGGNNYASVIIYSGHGESTRIINAIKCDTLSYKMAKVHEMIDQELYIRSITVMSEPLEIAIGITKDLADVCEQHHIVLMTDGCLVPGKWQVKEEVKKCLEVAAYCQQMGIYLNTIGFGQYYDRDFLTQLVKCAHTGQFLHMDAIKDYYKTVVSLAQQVGKQRVMNVPINHQDYFICQNKMRYQEPTTLRTIPTQGGMLIVCFEETGTPEGEVPEEMVMDFLYGLGAYHVMYEDLESAEVVLAQTQDIGAYMAVKDCYSFVEKGKALQTLHELEQDPKKRYKKGRAAIRIQEIEEEPLCLLEVLDAILKDSESKLLWDYQYHYKRIGIKTHMVDEAYHFVRPQMGYGEVVACHIGTEKLNVGVKVKIEGMVEEKATGLKVGATLYRDYNLIVNGNKNTSKLWCVLSKSLKSKLRKQKVIKSTTKVGGMSICTLDLTKLKTTNKRMQKALDQKKLAQYLYDIEVLGCKQWALKKLIEEQKNEDASLRAVDGILERFQINEKGVYIPNKVIKDEALPYEIYPAAVMTWKVEKFPKKKYQEEAINMYRELDYTALKQALNEVQGERRSKQDQVQLVRLAAGLIGKSPFLWEKQTEKAKKQTDNALGMNVVVGEKVQIATKTVDGIDIREDRYTVLTRCN
ncbi:MAG: vWA domain-containing protein [Cellulosilyticaceae bacterium]